MSKKKFVISGHNIANQQRVPKSIYGWPLMETAEIIIQGHLDWRSRAEERIQFFMYQRAALQSLSDLYNVNSLSKWSIDSLFLPWFYSKPIKTPTFKDFDYTSQYLPARKVVDKLYDLISSIDEYGYDEAANPAKRIIGYRLCPNSNTFYIRAGNHRAAVLAALDNKIPVELDHYGYLKSRDRKLIIKGKNFLDCIKIMRSYPSISKVENWPSVRTGILSLNDARKIYECFVIQPDDVT